MLYSLTAVGAEAAKAPAPASSALVSAPKDAAPALSEKELGELMDQAQDAMTRGEYKRAIQIYNKVLEVPKHQFRKDALELLGLARERSGQMAQAKAAYEEYLKLYPKDEGALRVRQRLAGLITAAWQPKEKLREQKASKKSDSWTAFGSFSQYLRQDVTRFDQGDPIKATTLFSLLDVNAKGQKGDVDILTRFNGGYTHDFSGGGSNDSSQLNVLFLDLNDHTHNLQARVGRQSAYSGGILGRFDGLILGYKFKPHYALNLVSGFPVESSTMTTPNTGRVFYGLNMDFSPFGEEWEFNAFFIQQKANGLLDRRAVGGEVRYLTPQNYLLSLLDYDISYKALNTLLVQGSWTLVEKTNLNFALDYRNSPPLTTSNALQGQTALTLDILNATFTEQEMRQLARDRTARNRMAMVGLSRTFDNSNRIDADLTVTNLSSTPASGGVAETPGTGSEYAMSFSYTAIDMMHFSDATIFGARYAKAATVDTQSAWVNSRLMVDKVWQINPRLRLDHRLYHDQTQKQWMLSPALKVERAWRKRMHFEAETGLEWINSELPTGTQNSKSYYLSLGYRADF